MFGEIPLEQWNEIEKTFDKDESVNITRGDRWKKENKQDWKADKWKYEWNEWEKREERNNKMVTVNGSGNDEMEGR